MPQEATKEERELGQEAFQYAQQHGGRMYKTRAAAKEAAKYWAERNRVAEQQKATKKRVGGSAKSTGTAKKSASKKTTRKRVAGK